MAESTEALKQRIKELEAKLSSLETSSNTDKLCQPRLSRSHEFKVEYDAKKTSEDSYTDRQFVSYGEEYSVHVWRKREKDVDEFTTTLLVRSLRKEQKFVVASVEVGLKTEKEPFLFKAMCEQESQHFVVGADGEVGYPRVFSLPMTEHRTYSRDVYVRVTIAVETIQPPDDADTTVIVKGEEIRVPAAYLSSWSLYFRAYFNAEMREKHEGKYPVLDDDIWPQHFKEMLSVIHPLSKPITRGNCMILLRLADRFEMPHLTRRLECFLVKFEKNSMERAYVFKIATEQYSLKLVQAVLLERWKNLQLLEHELLRTDIYKELSEETKAAVNSRFVTSFIEKKPEITHRG